MDKKQKSGQPRESARLTYYKESEEDGGGTCTDPISNSSFEEVEDEDDVEEHVSKSIDTVDTVILLTGEINDELSPKCTEVNIENVNPMPATAKFSPRWPGKNHCDTRQEKLV